MDIKALLGEQYREDMTLAEVEAALADYNLIDPSTLPKTVNKNIFDKTASELAAVKGQLRNKMTDEERWAKKEEEHQELLKQLQSDKCRLLMEKEFAAGGFSEKEYQPFIDSYQASDPEQAVMYAKSLVTFRAEDKKSIEQRLREEAYANISRPQTEANPEAAKTAFLQSFHEAQEKQDFVAMASITEQAASQNIQI